MANKVHWSRRVRKRSEEVEVTFTDKEGHFVELTSMYSALEGKQIISLNTFFDPILRQEDVQKLIPHLQKFVDTGEL